MVAKCPKCGSSAVMQRGRDTVFACGARRGDDGVTVGCRRELKIDPRLITDAEAEVAAGNIPRKDMMSVCAAIRQAREFPLLAREFNAEEVLLRAVGFKMELSL